MRISPFFSPLHLSWTCRHLLFYLQINTFSEQTLKSVHSSHFISLRLNSAVEVDPDFALKHIKDSLSLTMRKTAIKCNTGIGL